jgi:hypothetical protein
MFFLFSGKKTVSQLTSKEILAGLSSQDTVNTWVTQMINMRVEGKYNVAADDQAIIKVGNLASVFQDAINDLNVPAHLDRLQQLSDQAKRTLAEMKHVYNAGNSYPFVKNKVAKDVIVPDPTSLPASPYRRLIDKLNRSEEESSAKIAMLNDSISIKRKSFVTEVAGNSPKSNRSASLS